MPTCAWARTHAVRGAGHGGATRSAVGIAALPDDAVGVCSGWGMVVATSPLGGAPDLELPGPDYSELSKRFKERNMIEARALGR